MSKKVLVTLTDEEFNCVEKACEKLGFGISSYAKYKLLHDLLPDVSVSFAALIDEMNQSLANLQPGKTFIVSSLIEPSRWRTLSRSDKRSLSKTLMGIVDANPQKFERTDELTSDGTRIYRRL